MVFELSNRYGLEYDVGISFSLLNIWDIIPEYSNFVVDTASMYLATTSTECTNCNQNYYNPGVAYEVVSTDTITVTQDGMSFEGYLVKDMVCMVDPVTAGTSSRACLSDFEFLTMTSQTGLYATGVLGLAPPSAGNTNVSFISQLYAAGKITSETFTLQMSSRKETSYITLGAVPETVSDQAQYESTLVTQTDNPSWAFKTGLITYGSVDNLLEINLNTAGADTVIIDSSSPYIKLPQVDYDAFIA